MLAESIGWRRTFLVAGLPGLALALVLLAQRARAAARALRSPRRRARRCRSARHCATLWALPSFRWLTLGGGLASFAGTGFGAWVPTMFVRVHDMSLAEVGRTYAWYNVPAAIVGTLLTRAGSPTASRVATRAGCSASRRSASRSRFPS